MTSTSYTPGTKFVTYNEHDEDFVVVREILKTRTHPDTEMVSYLIGVTHYEAGEHAGSTSRWLEEFEMDTLAINASVIKN